jgi:FAD/FMN-containing dehydrogenase
MSLIVSPRSIEEVCEIMKLATSEGWTVVPAGGMTWLDAGQSLSSVNLILSTQRLTRIIEHEPADLVAITESGVTLKSFNETLGIKGQWLPIDPPDDIKRVHSTIGGVVATGLGGAQQFGYGAPRRHVIGMKIVRADGSIIKVGGRVVKNVAGYDLCKLFTGSYGTLGVIVEVNFKLRPVPFRTRTVMAWGRRENLLASALQIIKTGLFPVAVELLSPALASQAELSEAGDHFLLTRFAGSPNSVDQQVARAMEQLARDGARAPGCFAEDDNAIWRALAALPFQFTADVVWRVGLQPNDTGSFLELVTRTQPAELLWHAGVGDGRIRVVERRQSADNDSEELQTEMIERIRKLRARAESLGGSLIIEHAPASIKNLVNPWGTFGSAGGIMQRVKQHLDPDGILSPGRFGF